MIYNGGTGKVMFLGALRITTIFVFGVSCLVVAPAFDADAFPWWASPASKSLECVHLASVDTISLTEPDLQ